MKYAREAACFLLMLAATSAFLMFAIGLWDIIDLNVNEERWLAAVALAGMLAGQVALLKLRPPVNAAIAAVLCAAGASVVSLHTTPFPWATNLAGGIWIAAASAYCGGCIGGRIGGFAGILGAGALLMMAGGLPGFAAPVLMAWQALFTVLLGKRANA